MKKIQLSLVLVCLFAASFSYGQTTLVEDWYTSTASWFSNTSDLVRGIGYNPVTDHLLVASRVGGNEVCILDADTGSFIDYLTTTGVTGGTYLINKVDTNADGEVFLCNLGLQSLGTPLKIYRWDNEAGTPNTIVDYTIATAGERFGDGMRVVGSGVNTRIYIAGSGHAKVRVYQRDGTLQSEITVPAAQYARQGLGPEAPDGAFWGTGSGQPMRRFDNSGTQTHEVEGTIIPSSSSSAEFQAGITLPVLGAKDLLITNNSYTLGFGKILIADVTDPSAPVVLYESPDLQHIASLGTANGTFQVDWRNDTSNDSVFGLCERGGVGLYSIPIPPTNVDDWNLY